MSEATGLTAEEARAVADYLASVRPREPGRRLLRASVLTPAAPTGPADGARSGAPVAPRASGGPAEPGRPVDGGGAPSLDAEPEERLPAGPDPVLAEGRPRKPLEQLTPRVREAVERGAERWSAEGCAGCHPGDAEVRAWAGAFPQAPLFRPEEGVVTLIRAVEHWRRRPDGPLDADAGLAGGDSDILAYLAWRADGAPMAPGRAYPLPPAVDLERLERTAGEGRALAEGGPDAIQSGACGGCHGTGGTGPAAAPPPTSAGENRPPAQPAGPEIVGSAASFPRFAPELGRVGTLEEYLTAHLATAFQGEPVTPAGLAQRGSPELTAVLAYLSWLARDRLVDIGRPPGARPRGSVDLGRELYQLRCGICHDPGDRGRGALGPGLAGLFARLRHDTESVTRVVRSGARGMPAFFDLTTAQLEDLLAYLRTL